MDGKCWTLISVIADLLRLFHIKLTNVAIPGILESLLESLFGE